MISIRENLKILNIPDGTANTKSGERILVWGTSLVNQSGESILVWGTSLGKYLLTTGENIKSVRSCTVT